MGIDIINVVMGAGKIRDYLCDNFCYMDVNKTFGESFNVETLDKSLFMLRGNHSFVLFSDEMLPYMKHVLVVDSQIPDEKYFYKGPTIPSTKFLLIDSVEQMFRDFTRVMDLYNVVLPVPNFRRHVECESYPGWGSVPNWMLEGTKVYDDDKTISIVMDEIVKGTAPSECWAFWARRCGVELDVTDVGAGPTVYRWIEYGYKIHAKKIPIVLEGEVTYEEIEPRGPSSASAIRLEHYVEKLCETYPMFERTIKNIVLTHKTEAEEYIIGLLTLFAFYHENMKDEWLLSTGILLLKEEDYNSCMDDVHVLSRATMTWFGMKLDVTEYNHYLYWNMYIGKLTGEADINKEIADRTKTAEPKLSYDVDKREWTNEQYQRDFLAAMTENSKEFEFEARKLTKSFQEFIDTAFEWVAPGSVGGYSAIGDEHKRAVTEILRVWHKELQETKVRLNKRGLFENPDAVDKLRRIILEGGDSTTKMATKNEVKALRALFPANIAHYIIFSYFLNALEKATIPEDTLIKGGMGKELRLMYNWTGLAGNMSKLMYDFKNFNIQHSIEDMQTTLNAAYAFMSKGEEHREMRAACTWLTQSFSQMWYVKDTGEKIRFTRGLLSGWRGTSWINTILNKAYVTIARYNCKRLYKFDPVVMYVGAGDDVAIAGNTIHQLSCFYRVMGRIGYEATTSKQLLGTNVAEFLRNTYSTGGCIGSVHRSLSQFISGNWLSAEFKTPYERLAGIRDALAMAKRRGCGNTLSEVLWTCAVRRWGNINVEGVYRPLRREEIHSTKATGGYGIATLDGKLLISDGHKFKVGLPNITIVGPVNMSRQQALRELKDAAMYGVELKESATLTSEKAAGSYLASVMSVLPREERESVGVENAPSANKVLGELTWVGGPDTMLLRRFVNWTIIGDAGDKTYYDASNEFNRLKAAVVRPDELLKCMASKYNIRGTYKIDRRVEWYGPIICEAASTIMSSVQCFAINQSKDIPEAINIANTIVETIKMTKPGILHN